MEEKKSAIFSLPFRSKQVKEIYQKKSGMIHTQTSFR